MTVPSHIDLEQLYRSRFDPNEDYRRAVWRVLVSDFFSQFIPPGAAVLDLGCGYGEFINAVKAPIRLAIDMNPAAKERLAADVQFFLQDSSRPWEGIKEESLDVVFTSNLIEHLPDKAAVARTLHETRRCLKRGGRFIALGANIKYLGGHYWDFWDHQIPFTENSLAEGLRAYGFSIDLCAGRFLPFTMSSGRRYPLVFLKLYLALPLLWRLFGRQFLVVARKQESSSPASKSAAGQTSFSAPYDASIPKRAGTGKKTRLLRATRRARSERMG
jgi:SAM-dependent methyltransferase